MEAREMTFGERACGMSFNPGGREDVELIKPLAQPVQDHAIHVVVGLVPIERGVQGLKIPTRHEGAF